MIISLFMDETPLVSGSGMAPGMRARVQAAGGGPDALRHHRGDDRHEPDQHARNVHGSAIP
jgi:hypothetical protein